MQLQPESFLTPWVHPDTVIEKGFATLNVVVGAVVFAAILGNITAMINSFDKSNAQLREVMATLNRLIGKYDVPNKLQKRVFMCALASNQSAFETCSASAWVATGHTGTMHTFGLRVLPC